MSIHDGHRSRLRKRFLAGGCAIMNEHELLELILTYSIPRRDVNPLAHRLIERYGSLDAVLSADHAELSSNAGISDCTAALLSIFGAARSGAFMTADSKHNERLYSVRDAMRFCMRMFACNKREGSCAIFLNSKGIIIDMYFDPGEPYAAAFDIKKLVRRAVSCGAVRVVIGHCHISGAPNCSEADKGLNRRVASVLSELDIALAEHIIVTPEDCVALMHNVSLKDLVSDEEKAQGEPLRLIG